MLVLAVYKPNFGYYFFFLLLVHSVVNLVYSCFFNHCVLQWHALFTLRSDFKKSRHLWVSQLPGLVYCIFAFWQNRDHQVKWHLLNLESWSLTLSSSYMANYSVDKIWMAATFSTQKCHISWQKVKQISRHSFQLAKKKGK